LTVQPHREWVKVIVQMPQLCKLVNKIKHLKGE
jgi:hypothetical protein